MANDSILAQIDAEIARLTQARKLLAGASGADKLTRKASAGGVREVTKRKRVLSPEARKRIADAQRRRWAAQRKSKKDA